MKVILNLIVFYVGWCVGVLQHNTYAAVIVLSLAMLNALIMHYKTRELIMIFALAILGCMSDVVAYSCGLYAFTYTSVMFTSGNLWLVSLWLLFLTTFNSSLKILLGTKIYILSLIGFLGGMASYFVASKMHTIE